MRIGAGPAWFFADAISARSTPRTGQLAALGCDLLEFIDVLGLKQPALVGHDWGARAVAIACGLRPGVASHLAMLSAAYGSNDPSQALSLAQARNYWYHWFMATPRGERTVRGEGRNFAQVMWDTWSPPGWYQPEEFDVTAKAFDNADRVDITLHSYRHRWGHASGDPRPDEDEYRLSPVPVLDVPTLVLYGAADGANHPDTSLGREASFRGPYERRLLAGVGHSPQREAPGEVLAALLHFFQSFCCCAEPVAEPRRVLRNQGAMKLRDVQSVDGFFNKRPWTLTP